MANRAFLLTLFAISFLLLHQHLDSAVASRPLHMHPPAIISQGSLKRPLPPSTALLYSINRHKFTETEAFRPTAPGHSSGVGHGNPPAAP
ncbi:conserved hypothetical protein [Ricinus communis]|uniref:Uncharacterized protein n=1 Tax=Ricinus communis TaxID=3988 RepID=B9S1S2_RICCO|nr:conserved hypothetical protein [Ricinus communis]